MGVGSYGAVVSCLGGDGGRMPPISLSNLTHMMSMADPLAIGAETLMIDSGCSLEKEFIELIRMNP